MLLFSLSKRRCLIITFNNFQGQETQAWCVRTPAGLFPFPGQDRGPRAPLEGNKKTMCAEQVREAQNRNKGVVMLVVLVLMRTLRLVRPREAECTMYVTV